MITLWDVEGGLPQLDKYLYSNDQAVVAGALLGVGIVNANVRVRSPGLWQSQQLVAPCFAVDHGWTEACG